MNTGQVSSTFCEAASGVAWTLPYPHWRSGNVVQLNEFMFEFQLRKHPVYFLFYWNHMWIWPLVIQLNFFGCLGPGAAESTQGEPGGEGLCKSLS